MKKPLGKAFFIFENSKSYIPMSNLFGDGMKMKKKKILLLVLIILFAGMKNVYAATLSDQSLYATYCAVIDSTTGRVLFEKNGYEQVPMASTTKILTCILILEEGNLEDYAKVSKYAASMPKVRMGVREGQYYKVEDLLYALMLESYNDVAVVLAEYLSNTVENFAKALNQKAQDIGCKSYCFITPNGLDASMDGQEHSISAVDLAKIMAYCSNESPQKEDFLQITTTSSYCVEEYELQDGTYVVEGSKYLCTNKNSFLSHASTISGKTGYTNKAGYCYVGQAQTKDGQISFSLLACGWPNNKNYKWKDAAKIIKYIEEHYELRPLVFKDEMQFANPVIVNGKKYVNGPHERELSVMLSEFQSSYFAAKEDVVSYIYNMEKEVVAPIGYGEKIGEIQVYINEYPVEVIKILSAEEIEENTWMNCICEIIVIFLSKIKNMYFIH